MAGNQLPANTEATLLARRVDRMSSTEKVMWGGFYASGIIGMLIVYGLLQERIMTIPYTDTQGNAQRFGYSVFLIFLNRLFAVVFAMLMARKNGEELTNMAPIWKYLIVSASNVFASSCQYEALKHVSFAVQMLGKSFKMLPVMLWGLILSGKVYSLQDWFIAMAVTGGVTEFLMTGPTQANTDTPSQFTGYLWLLAFLALDGLTSTMQERLFKEHRTTKFNQMFYINGLSSIVSLMTLLSTGTFSPAFTFFLARPQFMVDALTLSSSAVAGQFFIYSQVQMFGALVLAATMNVRQIVSILLSYLTYHHYITGLQILGLVIVFAALTYKSYQAVRNDKKNDKNEAPETQPAGVEKEVAYQTVAESKC
eukprot:CAMPEP_0206425674 /NCGR_PEP_ID=MMETSP0324_2-20121206/3930_1 /ASSEMBLY_ACC=CAM_ASM_000836 /TAXON_ID=2866 /ORGANISM="Crypthecodinium cohnii, Strain Seligo" /LENGTH=366 /DNA_ID=CAMNT_0053890497 /DNA_START=49 /DNA_END=1149 /DNA_ORIENTATION=+